jgi:hypothetical protein
MKFNLSMSSVFQRVKATKALSNGTILQAVLLRTVLDSIAMAVLAG